MAIKGRDRSAGSNGWLLRPDLPRWNSSTRAAKVARIRKNIAKGTYWVPAEKIADKILRTCRS
ncbi:MAG: hypothetical protein DMG08_22620 [Acidobacteria bacterium]|nr:MAG: hypothetical protein DMG08_22620 [Acidobacteriota bacterium]PYV00738.1 MAG: hypothetical protein DMG10_20055 [Acidobacteriota bacterium]PYV33405.1 MAG: hypothetical protein DMG09_22420 [Acidobacteriota bacterium]